MANKQQKNSFLNIPWVASIGVFVLSQIIFILFEVTGWSLRYRELSGVFEKISESVLFKEWLNFYSIPQQNLITFIFAIAFLVPGIIGAVKSLFSKSSK